MASGETTKTLVMRQTQEAVGKSASRVGARRTNEGWENSTVRVPENERLTRTNDAREKGLSELQRRKRATLARIEASARDGETLRRRVKELEQRVARDRERVKAYDKVIQEGESSLDRILESSEFLLSALARETQTFEDDEDDVEE